MAKRSKRMREIDSTVALNKEYSVDEALAVLKNAKPTKFDQSVNLSLRLGIDVKKSDQQVRGTVSLPHGTGKKIRIAVIAKGDQAKAAEQANVDFVGAEELVEKIKAGWTDFDVLVTTGDMMREVGKLGKVLGPRALMPSPKAGTVTTDVATAIKELRAGKIEFKVDKTGNINNAVGKYSFVADKLADNVRAFIQAINRAKPAASKGVFLRSLYLSTTMGPGLKIDLSTVGAGA